MRIQTAGTLCVAAVLVCLSSASLLLSGCAASFECGSWNFSGTPKSASAEAQASFKVQSAFTFAPATCNKNCDCDIDAMIQMVWTYDKAEHTFVFPSSSYQNRATPNGWSIDQTDGWAFGWYGLLNDMTFDATYNATGSNGTPNTLYDKPAWYDNIVFYAVDAAVCFKSKTCGNRILGYYFWSWSVNNKGEVNEVSAGTAWTSLETEFQSAVADWNTWAPTSGPENLSLTIPGQPTLLNAVPFQTMTDL